MPAFLRTFSAACIVAMFGMILTAVSVSAAVFSPKTFILDNGLQVVVIENHRAPIVMQMLWYRVGAADEEPGESGLAHFLEQKHS